MPNPKLETYKNKATNTVYDLTDADAQSKLTSILDGTNIDSFGDVETAVAALQPKNLSHSIAGESTVEGALDAIAAGSGVTVDDAMSSSSTNPVQNKVITSALAGKQDTLTFDNFPTAGSNNPVKSGGVKSATTEIWGVIGPIEAGITSAHAYEVGDHFECYYGYVTVIAPIAVGDTIENNVNVVGGTIASTMTQDAKDAFPRDEQAVLGSESGWDPASRLPAPLQSHCPCDSSLSTRPPRSHPPCCSSHRPQPHSSTTTSLPIHGTTEVLSGTSCLESCVRSNFYKFCFHVPLKLRRNNI